MKIFLPKQAALVVALALTSLALRAQDYTWKKGSNAIDPPGFYGAGNSLPANNPSGRTGAGSWKDAAGNFWLFGGFGIDPNGTNKNLNDLWKYNPSTNIWTLMKGDSVGNQNGNYGSLGVAASSNLPGARFNPATWTDLNGNFWMFGGDGIGSTQTGELNDLWRYNPSANQWTWMNGTSSANLGGTYGTQGTAAAANNPGGRETPVAWPDAAGNLWLFSGYGYGTTGVIGSLNDLWKYNISTNQWTWMRGLNTLNANGTYGAPGAPAAGNDPGARSFSDSWTDASGNFWLLGGYGYPAAGNVPGILNDLWKYNSGTNQWTWVNGGNTTNQVSVYGTPAVAAASNMPGGRSAGVTWADANGNLWMFGGSGYSAPPGSPVSGNLNDLWKYNIASNQWTWMKGSNAATSSGIYGTQGIPAPLNTPGGRYTNTGWTDNTGGLWLFGGYGAATAYPNDGYLNDLWELQSCIIQTLAIQGPASICTGASTILTASGASSYSWSTQQTNTASIMVSPVSNTVYIVQSADPNGCKNTASISLAVNSLPLVNAGTSASIVCEGEFVNLTASGAATYSWSSGQNGSTIQVAASNALYTVTGTDANGCSQSASITQSAAICTGLKENAAPLNLLVYPNPASDKISITLAPGAVKAELYNTLGAHITTFVKENGSELEADLSALGIESGVYFISVSSNGVLSSQKIIYTKNIN